MTPPDTKIIGPFRQILPLSGLPHKGPISDAQLDICEDAGLLIAGDCIREIGPFTDLFKKARQEDLTVEKIDLPMVLLPGFIDCHTHICFGGSRARDYALRNAGKSYLEIARQGGGIIDSVNKTRAADAAALRQGLAGRATRHLLEGVTTCEVKSGYGLNLEDELKMLRAIAAVNREPSLDLIPTCLAAHMPPKDFSGSSVEYLNFILQELLPVVKKEQLADRVDIFIEDTAFNNDEARSYLRSALDMGFSITLHVDQFHAGGSALAVELQALSADHLEASGTAEIAALAASDVVGVVLPGCSLGLGIEYAPARQLLDAGVCLAIATDWNPGSAPMGDLLMQAAVLGAAQKLTTAEVFAGITGRAARALALENRGQLAAGKKADFIAFQTDDYREILYHQGKLKPAIVWKNGKQTERP